MEHRSRRLTTAVCLVAALTLTGCGGSDGKEGTPSDTVIDATPMADVTSAPPSGAKVIGVTVTADSVSPAGDKITVERGQPIIFEIDATAAGELHVHSSPATSIEYPAGKSMAQISIDRPGVVEAEIEDTGDLVVQVEVE